MTDDDVTEAASLMVAVCRLIHDDDRASAAALILEAPNLAALATVACVNLEQALTFYAGAAGTSFDEVIAAMGHKAAMGA